VRAPQWHDFALSINGIACIFPVNVSLLLCVLGLGLWIVRKNGRQQLAILALWIVVSVPLWIAGYVMTVIEVFSGM
jgi:hypothetical protein